jgi:hypothetical protein
MAGSVLVAGMTAGIATLVGILLTVAGPVVWDSNSRT